ncbi:MAG: hypothetical protein WD071_06920 [Pseudohongiella sp.]|uniref:hypothetical protein n=1 Tax=Pseudohongiella sp. TaxID=1979412 RepID=UPI00349FE919
MDNNRPVSSWSDDKLHRMQAKLQYTGSAATKAGNYESAKKHFEKLEEVKAEVEKRKTRSADDLVTKVSGLNPVDALNSNDMAQFIGMMGNKMAELTTRTMKENSCSEEQAKEIISARIEEIESELRHQGLSEDEVAATSMKRLLSL